MLLTLSILLLVNTTHIFFELYSGLSKNIVYNFLIGCCLDEERGLLKDLVPHRLCIESDDALETLNHLMFACPVNKNLPLYCKYVTRNIFSIEVLPENEISNEYKKRLMTGGPNKYCVF